MTKPKRARRANVAPSSPAETEAGAASAFPIIGIGASAGGLEALGRFFNNVPVASGMAFVVVQHLDPDRKGMLVELLQRVTAMPVSQAEDRTRIQPDHVYVCPPNRDMSILHGVIHLMEPLERRGLRLPIDFFFRALAEDQQSNSIGVILSGMGSDGTLGLRAIKGKAGASFVQDPASAAFDGMPNSALAAGLADVVAPVEELPAKILNYLRHSLSPREAASVRLAQAESALQKVIVLLRAQTGHDFSLYKPNTLYRRIERRMGIHGIDKIEGYVRFLQTNPSEVTLLFKELLIGVTSFFRDPAAWDEIKERILPERLALTQPGEVLRAWVPACSTGEEAYSLAIVFAEVVGQLQLPHAVSLQIFATDLDADAIEQARSGVFPANIAADVSTERLNRYFTQTERGFRITNAIREMVVFAPQDLIMDPPFTKLDFLCCRNLLIYMTPELQQKMLLLFHYSLKSDGILFLGSAETVGNFSNLFEAVSRNERIYRRLDSVATERTAQIPISTTLRDVPAPALPQAGKETNIQLLAEKLLLARYAPPAVLTNERGEILFINARTGKYLEPAAGKANWNLFSMARPGLDYALSSHFSKAVRQGAPVTISNVAVGTNGGTQLVNVVIEPILPPSLLAGLVLVAFIDVPVPPEVTKSSKPQRRSVTRSPKIEELEEEIERLRIENQAARADMQSAQEELRSTNEEMQSANEEMQSVNEELQSTNEELTTSKEEMQSMNEELQTVNQELQSKVDALLRTNNDMRNLLDSTDIATLFLDDALRVRRFTPHTTQVFRLLEGDVNRPITDITTDLIYPELVEDIKGVVRTLIRVVKEIPTKDGRWFNMRILPYRTMDNIIDGVVLTFTDITIAKKLEAELRMTQLKLKAQIESPK